MQKYHAVAVLFFSIKAVKGLYLQKKKFWTDQERKQEFMKEKPRARSRKKKSFPLTEAIIATGVALTAVTGMGVGYYIYKGKEYETTFFPSTKINGIDASDKTVDEMEELIAAQVDDYELTLVKRGGDTEKIKGKDIGLSTVFDGELEQYLSEQEPMEWMLHLTERKNHEINATVVYDEDKLTEKLDSLGMFDEEQVQKPQNAYLSEYIPGQGYEIVPEQQGNSLDKDKVEEFVKTALQNLDSKLVLDELDVYEKPAITADNEELQEQAQRLNHYQDMSIIYEFGDKQEVLDGDTISQWVTLGEDGTAQVDREAVAAYVKDLASSYNTAYQKKVLKTSYGPTVEITKGSYGWRIDQDEETEALYQILLSGESQAREPIYLQKAASHGENDYGDTYVEINLTAQHLYFYKNGQLLVESDFVSGNQSRGYDTPSGAYPLTYKQRNATLRGENYATPVSYWMPFNGNIGMHDASWRGSFGGNIYKTNGSHGCVNLPPSVAKTIFENIEAGMPVLCYHLEGTESGKKTSAAAASGVTTPTETTPPAQNTTPTVNPGTVTPPAATTPENSGAVTPGGEIAGSNPGETGGENIAPGTDMTVPSESGVVMPSGDGSSPGITPDSGSPGDMGPGITPGDNSSPGEIGPGITPGDSSSGEIGPWMGTDGNSSSGEIGPWMGTDGNGSPGEAGPGMQLLQKKKTIKKRQICQAQNNIFSCLANLPLFYYDKQLKVIFYHESLHEVIAEILLGLDHALSHNGFHWQQPWQQPQWSYKEPQL